EYYRLCRPGAPNVGGKHTTTRVLAERGQQLLTEHPREAAHAFQPLVTMLEQLLDDGAAAGVARTVLDSLSVADQVRQSAVLKLESAEGDFSRYYDDAVSGTAAYFAWANRGKESVVFDLKSTTGRDALERLLARADVLVQNLAPGAAERFGVDARSASARH